MCGTFWEPSRVRDPENQASPSGFLRAQILYFTPHYLSLPITVLKAIKWQDGTQPPQMTPFWKVDTPSYFLRGMLSSWNILYFATSCWNMTNFFLFIFFAQSCY